MPGMGAQDLDKVSGKIAKECGFGMNVQHLAGHGVGIELDELPVLTATDLALEEGMVFALEPKFVLPDFGAIGIENTYCVREHGLEALTTAPEGLCEL